MTEMNRLSMVDFVISSFDTAQQKTNWIVAIVAGMLSVTSVQLNNILVVVTIVLGILNSSWTLLKIRNELRNSGKHLSKDS